MKELQTILGTDIPLSTRGVLYLCHYDYNKKTLTVGQELLFDTAFEALHAYANIPNLESQVEMGEDYNELICNLHRLHKNMKNTKWLKQLEETL